MSIPARAPGTVRVLTWNLWWRFGPWQARQPAIAATLAAVASDVVCLQEVWHDDASAEDVEGGPITGGQAATLAGELGFDHRFATARRAEVLFGNAILSRWPIGRTEAVSLDPKPAQTPGRCALAAVIEHPGGPLPVVCTHLDWEFADSALRQSQAATVAELAARVGGDAVTFPVVVCGDLNAVPDSDEVRSLTGRRPPAVPGQVFTDAWEVAGVGPGWTVDPANPWLVDTAWPRRRIDYVLVAWPRRAKPVGNVAAAHLIGIDPVGGIVPSDHYGVVADLRAP